MGGAVVVPAVLVGAHELHAHRLADGLRHHRGGLRGVLVATASEGAGALVILDADLVDREPEHLGQHGARVVDVLGRGHYQRAARADVGERAIGTERRMRLVRAAVARRRDMGGLREGLGRIAPVGDHRVGGLGGPHIVEHAGMARQRRGFLPRHLERADGLDGVPLALRDNAEEVALAHDPRRDVLDRVLVDADRLGAGAVSALAARAHHAAVQHAGQPHVLHVQVGPARLVRNVDARNVAADQRVAVDRLLRRGAGELDVERLVADERPVADRLGRVAVDRDHAFRHNQAPRLDAEPGRGERQQRLPGLGGGGAQLRPAAVDRRARGGGALVGRHVGVELHPAELAHVEIELFAGDLQEPGRVALAELALAEIDGRGVVGMHRDPGVDRVRVGRAGDVAARGRGAAAARSREAEADDEGAAALEQVAAGERRIGERGAHRVAPAIRVDASLIACMTRG
jgi:hypothetical protein